MTLQVDLPPTGACYEFAEEDYRILRDLITVVRRRARMLENDGPAHLPALLTILDRLDHIADLATIVKGDIDNGK